jgi:hypothetical protein
VICRVPIGWKWSILMVDGAAVLTLSRSDRFPWQLFQFIIIFSYFELQNCLQYTKFAIFNEPIYRNNGKFLCKHLKKMYKNCNRKQWTLWCVNLYFFRIPTFPKINPAVIDVISRSPTNDGCIESGHNSEFLHFFFQPQSTANMHSRLFTFLMDI